MNILEKDQHYKALLLQALNLLDNVFAKSGWCVEVRENSLDIINMNRINENGSCLFYSVPKRYKAVRDFQITTMAFIKWHTMYDEESCERKLRKLLQVAAADYTSERVIIGKEDGHRIYKVLVDHEITARGYMNFLALHAEKIINANAMRMEVIEEGCCVKILKEALVNGGHWGWLKRFNHSMYEVTKSTRLNGDVGVHLFPGEVVQGGRVIGRVGCLDGIIIQ